jgi:uncharacterized protein
MTLKDALIETNKWWTGKFTLDYKEREIYPELEKFFAERQILALIGMRRVGKTTLMLRLAQNWIESGHDAKRLLYFSFDDFRNVRIDEVLDAYTKLMEVDLGSGKYLILLDELQKVDGWAEQLKRIYDNKKNIKIIISGSESLFIRKGSRESLAGRFYEFQIGPLTFKEFLAFRGVEVKNLNLQEKELSALFRKYILCNGFPEIIDSEETVIKKYLKEGIIEKAVYRDIPQIMPVSEPAILESLFKLIMTAPGQMSSMGELAGELGISRQTVSQYLDYLEKSFLIKKLYNFSGNARKTERKLKKYYPTVFLKGIEEGALLETAAVLGCNAEFFWRDPSKREVDIVLDGRPIEVKSGKIETNNLLYFMEKYGVNEGFVLTWELEEKIGPKGKHVIVKPLWKWLLEKDD